MCVRKIAALLSSTVAVVILMQVWCVMPCLAQSQAAQSQTVVNASALPDPIVFEQHIAPLLRKKCVSCHRSKQAEGGLSLETPEAIKAGGESGKVWTDSDPSHSLLYARVSGEEEPLMPPEDNSVGAEPLTAMELQLLAGWIRAGASFDASPSAESLPWQPIPETVRNSFALTVSPDDQMAAVARANRIDVLDMRTGTIAARLIDPNLNQPGAADVDVIGAIAFSPMGNHIATGGYRSLRLWQRIAADPVPQATLDKINGQFVLSNDRKRAAVVDALGDVHFLGLREEQAASQFTCEGTVQTLCFAGADFVAIGSESGNVDVVDYATGSVVRTHQLSQSISALSATSPETLAVLLGDGSVEFLLQSEGKHLIAEDMLSGVSAVFLLDESRVALGTQAGTIRLLDLQTGKVWAQLDQGATVNAFAISPDGTTLASGDRSGTVKTWTIQDGKPQLTLVGNPRSRLKRNMLERDVAREQIWLDQLKGKTEGINKTLETEQAALKKVEEAHAKAEKELEDKLKEREKAAQQIAGSEKSIEDAKAQQIKADRESDAIKTMVAETQQQIDATMKSFQLMDEQLAKAVSAQKVAEQALQVATQLAGDTKRVADELATTAKKQQAALSGQKQMLARFNQQLQDAVKTSADAKARAEAAEKALPTQREALEKQNQERKAKQRELADRTQALVTSRKTRDRAAEQIPKHKDQLRQKGNQLAGLKRNLESTRSGQSVGVPVVAVAYSPNGKSIVVADQPGGVRVFDSVIGIPLDHRSVEREAAPMQSAVISFYRDDEFAVSHASGATDWYSMNSQWELQATVGSPGKDVFEDRVTAIDYRPDGSVIAVGSGSPSRNGQVLLISAADGTVLKQFDGLHSDSVLCVRFSPDGKTLASASADKSIRLLDVASGKVVGALDGHTHHVLSIAWRRDGRLLASGSADGTVKTWDPISGQRQRTIGGFPEEVTDVQFVADTSTLASVCADGWLRLHDANNGKYLRGAAAAGDFLFSLGLSSDGQQVLSSGQLGDVHRWLTKDASDLGDWK